MYKFINDVTRVRAQIKLTHGILPRVIQGDVDQQWSTSHLLKHATMHAQLFVTTRGSWACESAGGSRGFRHQLARRFRCKGESLFIFIHMWHAVVVIETRCELVLDCMRGPRGVRAPGRRLPANRQAWQAIAGEPTSQCRRPDKRGKQLSANRQIQEVEDLTPPGGSPASS